jgi:hypothetical protein
MSRRLNSYLVSSILGPIPSPNIKDAGRYIEVKPLGDVPSDLKVGSLATFIDRAGKKISGKVETPLSAFGVKDYLGSNFLVDSFATS